MATTLLETAILHAQIDGFACLAGFLSFILHLDVHLGQIIAKYGRATYAILFGIVFCETGFVITPFLPGKTFHSIFSEFCTQNLVQENMMRPLWSPIQLSAQ